MVYRLKKMDRGTSGYPKRIPTASGNAGKQADRGIIRKFATEHPHIKIMFLGSDPVRNSLYKRILKIYYGLYSKEVRITAAIRKDGRYED